MDAEGMEMSAMKRSEDMGSSCLFWTQLTCKVKRFSETSQVILSDVSGMVKSGEMVGILGPSGAGKSTLLNCLMGNRKPDSGSVKLHGLNNDLRLAFVDQKDDLCSYLTVSEYLNFAAKFKLDSKVNQSERITQVLTEYNLEDCANNLVTKCSGGERRRVSIALEVISNPDILILDEPTTGLDSFTANKVVASLKRMTKNGHQSQSESPPAMILLTIHQPGSQLFAQFDRVYILSQGKSIYTGPPLDIETALTELGLRMPQYYNPADFMMDVALGNHGAQVLEACHELYSQEAPFPELKNVDSEYEGNLAKMLKGSNSNHFGRSLISNTKKLLLANIRDPQQYLARLLVLIGIPLLFTFQHEYNHSPCFFQFSNQSPNVTIEETVSERLFGRKKYIRGEVMAIVYPILSAMFVSILPTFLAFADQVRAFLREERNMWYSTSSFFIGWTLANTLISTGMSVLNTLLILIANRRQLTMVSVVSFIGQNVLFTLIYTYLGFLLALGFSNHLTVGVIAASTTIMMSIIFAGTILKESYLRPFFQVVQMFNPFTYDFGGNLASLLDSTCAPSPDFQRFKFDQVVDFVNLYNVNSGQVDKLEPLMNIPPKTEIALMEYNWTRQSINNYLQAMNDLNETQVEQLDNFWETGLNMAWTEYSVKGTDIYTDTIILLGILIGLHLLSHLCLTIKVASKK